MCDLSEEEAAEYLLWQAAVSTRPREPPRGAVVGPLTRERAQTVPEPEPASTSNG